MCNGNCKCKEVSEVLELKVKYHDDDMPKIEFIEGEKSDWFDLCSVEYNGGMYDELSQIVTSGIFLKAGEFKLINLGVSMEIPKGFEALIIPRSSTFKKFGLIQANSIGLIDNSYCGDNDIWMMPVYATKDVFIPQYARLCQFRIIENMPSTRIMEVKSLNNKDRSGIGSTGL